MPEHEVKGVILPTDWSQTERAYLFLAVIDELNDISDEVARDDRFSPFMRGAHYSVVSDLRSGMFGLLGKLRVHYPWAAQALDAALAIHE